MRPHLNTLAVVLEEPERLSLSRLDLTPPGDADVVVDIAYSGISTGTERLLWSGKMPMFPGMGYPLVPGYESVGRVAAAGADAGLAVGTHVFVPGARCFGPVRGLFGGAARRLVVAAERVAPLAEDMGEEGTLLALAATAHHAMAAEHAALPDLIVGHGVLGRLLARVTVALGGAPTVWETNPARAQGGVGYGVLHPEDDDRKEYAAIYDVSGDPKLLDTLIARLRPQGEVVLAGFYSEALSFSFPPAFMREARIRVAAEWKRGDLDAILALIAADRLSLGGLITHRHPAAEADEAYRTAFTDPECLKMILDWSDCS